MRSIVGAAHPGANATPPLQTARNRQSRFGTTAKDLHGHDCCAGAGWANAVSSLHSTPANCLTEERQSLENLAGRSFHQRAMPRQDRGAPEGNRRSWRVRESPGSTPAGCTRLRQTPIPSAVIPGLACPRRRPRVPKTHRAAPKSAGIEERTLDPVTTDGRR